MANNLTQYLPQPFYGVGQAYNDYLAAGSNTVVEAKKSFEIKAITLSVRTGLVATGIFAVSALGLNPLTTLLFSAAVISLPAALLYAGTLTGLAGISFVVNSLFTGLVGDLVAGGALVLLGGYFLEESVLPKYNWGAAEVLLRRNINAIYAH